jgi:hypothetical protein
MKQKKKEPAQKQKSQKGAVVFPDKRLMYYSGGVAALMVIARGITSFFPDGRLWGLNYTAFLPLPSSVFLLAASFLLCTPLLYRGYTVLAEFFFGNRRQNVLYGTALALCAGILFWIFRMETYFLGDGAAYLAEQYRFIQKASVATDFLFGKNSAPLTGIVLAYFARAIDGLALLREYHFSAPLFTFWFFGVGCGIAYVSGCLHAARSLFDSPEERFGTFALCLFTPGVLFYFGYVEYYTFYFTCIFFYFFLLVRAVEGTVSVVVPALMLALATAFHFMSVIALPSLIFLFLHRSSNESLRRFVQLRYVMLLVTALLVLGAVVYFTSGMYANGNRNVMSLFPYHVGRKMQYYTLLSSWHLFDFMNFLFLIAAPVCIGIALFFKRSSLKHPEILLAFTNLAFFSCLAFFGNTSLGIARDWDINAGLGLAVIFFVIALARHTNQLLTRKYLMFLMAGSALATGCGWFASNIDTASSVGKFRAILALDDMHIPGDYALAGYEHLRKHYYTQQDSVHATWAIQKKIECCNYPNDYRDFLNSMRESASAKEQQQQYDWMFGKLRTVLDSLQRIKGDSVAERELRTLAEITCEALYDSFYSLGQQQTTGSSSTAPFTTFDSIHIMTPILSYLRHEFEWLKTGEEHTMEELRAASTAVHYSSRLLLLIGRSMNQQYRFDEASPVFERSYNLDTTFKTPLVYLAFAEANRRQANLPKAKALLEKYLAGTEDRSGTSGSIRDYAIQLLNEINDKMNQ